MQRDGQRRRIRQLSVSPLMKNLLFLALLGWSSASVPAHAMSEASPQKVAGFTYVKTVGPISEYRLDANGLQVLLLPEHSTPTLTFMVTYRVGSRNEVTGTTGATHLLEHLMFKGSEKFNDAKGNSVKQLLERIGGENKSRTKLQCDNSVAEIREEFLLGYHEGGGGRAG